MPENTQQTNDQVTTGGEQSPAGIRLKKTMKLD
jgi:hypothetical protein